MPCQNVSTLATKLPPLPPVGGLGIEPFDGNPGKEAFGGNENVVFGRVMLGNGNVILVGRLALNPGPPPIGPPGRGRPGREPVWPTAKLTGTEVTLIGGNARNTTDVITPNVPAVACD